MLTLRNGRLNIPILLASFLSLIAASGSAASVHQKPIQAATVLALQQHFAMREALGIIANSVDRSKSKTYLSRQKNRFHSLATQEQPPMVLDGYTVNDEKAPIIGYSLFYHGATGPLVILDAAVNPLRQGLAAPSAALIRASFDSVSAAEGRRMHFLGIYDLDARRVLKIMVLEGKGPLGPEYQIRYAVSER